MREYRYLATRDTRAALDRLRGGWAACDVSAEALVVRLVGGGCVRVSAEPREVEEGFRVFRLAAQWAVESRRAEGTPAPAFADGGNQVLLFSAEEWIEELDEPVPAPRYAGLPGMRRSSAVAVCRRTHALLLGSPSGAALLVQCGAPPRPLLVTDESAAILSFLAAQGYLG